MRKYSISWTSIILVFIVDCLLWRLAIYWSIEQKSVDVYKLFVLLITLFFSYTFYWLIEKRIRKKYLFCDSEGIVFNFNGDKLYWYEIDDISSSFYRTTTTIICVKEEFRAVVGQRLGAKKTMEIYRIEWAILGHAEKFHNELINSLKKYK